MQTQILNDSSIGETLQVDDSTAEDNTVKGTVSGNSNPKIHKS